MVPTEGYNPDSRAPSRSVEHNCRQVSGNEGQNGLDTEPRGVHPTKQTVGPTGSGPLHQPTPMVLQLETRPRGRNHECLLSTMGQVRGKGYANPPVGRTLSQVQALRMTLVLVAPVWKTQACYPTLLGMLVDLLIMLHHQDGLIQLSTPLAALEVELQLATWPISGNNTETRDF